MNNTVITVHQDAISKEDLARMENEPPGMRFIHAALEHCIPNCDDLIGHSLEPGEQHRNQPSVKC
jgi:hypothetical protein